MGLIKPFLFFFAAVALQMQQPTISLDKKYLRPPENIKYFTFGYSDLMSGVLWIRLLQNIDFCEGGKVTEDDYVKPVETEKSKVLGIVKRQLAPSKCNKGWVFSMIDTITEILPRFKLAYDMGANFLSVVVDDREGARLIYEKGLVLYPTDWRLSYGAAYHYMWEVQDMKRAAVLLEQTIRNGGPPLMSSLSATIYTELGQAQLAKNALLNALERNPIPVVRERILQRLGEVENILQKSP